MSHLRTAYNLGASHAQQEFAKHAQGRVAGQAFPKGWGDPMPPADTGANLQNIRQNYARNTAPRTPMPTGSGAAAKPPARPAPVPAPPPVAAAAKTTSAVQPAAAAAKGNLGSLGLGPIAAAASGGKGRGILRSPSGGGIDPQKLRVGGASAGAAAVQKYMP